MKTALKRKTQVFGHATQTCTIVMVLVNLLETPKLWAIGHENGHKRINDEFFSFLSKMYRLSYSL
jgi:hypothetical protein